MNQRLRHQGLVSWHCELSGFCCSKGLCTGSAASPSLWFPPLWVPSLWVPSLRVPLLAAAQGHPSIREHCLGDVPVHCPIDSMQGFVSWCSRQTPGVWDARPGGGWEVALGGDGVSGAGREMQERYREGSSGKELPVGVLLWDSQPCSAPRVCAWPLPQHRRFLQRIYLLHIALSDGPAGSQDLSHLGHDRVIVHAGHSHHLVTPRAGQSRVVRAAPGGHGSITQKATCWREAGSKEKHLLLQGQDLSPV